jgi:hypothetical protein
VTPARVSVLRRSVQERAADSRSIVERASGAPTMSSNSSCWRSRNSRATQLVHSTVLTTPSPSSATCVQDRPRPVILRHPGPRTALPIHQHSAKFCTRPSHMRDIAAHKCDRLMQRCTPPTLTALAVMAHYHTCRCATLPLLLRVSDVDVDSARDRMPAPLPVVPPSARGRQPAQRWRCCR